MELIKDKEALIKNANELFDCCGNPKEIAEIIEDLIFSYIELGCKKNDCIAEYDWERISTAREVKNFFNNIETK